LIEKVVFYNDKKEPEIMEFEGFTAEFFRTIRETFCNPRNMNAKALMFSGEFLLDEGKKLATIGGMVGDREALIKICANFILQVAANTPGVDPKYVICEITDTALRAYRGIRDAKKSEGGLLLP